MKHIKGYIFLAGFAITGVEMAASRFLAPYFGTSHIVWANVIGVILLGMAIGYAVGGKLVDKYPSEKGLFGIGALGAIILAFLPVVANILLTPLSKGILQTEMGIILATFIATLILFGCPIFLLAMLSPYAVRLLSNDVNIVGSRSGSLSFWSTLGSILGIYITSFFLVPFVGIRESVWLFALLLFIPSILYLPKKLMFSSFFVAVILVSYFIPATPAAAFGTLLHQEESQYQHIKVVADAQNTKYLYFNEGQGIQSVYNPAKPLLGMYYDYAALFPLLSRFSAKKDLNVLVIGYAGGSIGKLMHAYAPSDMTLHIDGVEIDPNVTKLSKEYFGVQDNERALYTMDGRTFLKQVNKQYDIVIVDAYSQEIYIPPHMITREFFTEIADKLSSEGVLAFNINVRDIDGELFQGTMKTLQAAALQTYYMHVPDSYNHWVLGTKTASLEPSFSTLPEDVAPLSTIWKEGFTIMPPVTKGEVFTDNRSPVEMLIHGEILGELLQR